MDSPFAVCVIAPPGRLRDSLRVLLRVGHPAVVIHEADDAAQGLQMIQTLRPRMALVDSALENEDAWRMLSQLRGDFPGLFCCLMTHTHEQECRAQSALAQVILPVGFSAADFWAAVQGAGLFNLA